MLFTAVGGDLAAAQEGVGAVYIVPITGTIDLGLAPYLERVIDDAEEAEAAAILLEIDTPGGRLDAVLQMQDALLGSSVLVIAYVDRTAFSAGALVAIAAHRIYMAPGAVIGAATPIDGATGETSSEKVISAVRTTFRTTAEARGRDPRVAEAMVDPDVAIDGLIERGKLLTLTTTDAQQWGYAEGVFDSQAELLAAEGLASAPVVETSPSLAERAVRFITDPVIASLLILLGLLLIVGDFLVEGVGVPALIGAGLLAAFFWGHMLAGLTGWEDVALVVLGVVLIAVELLVLPGFGVPGILGLLSLFGGLFLAVLSRDIRTPEQTERAATIVGVAFVGVVLGFMTLLFLLPRSPRMGGLVLESQGGGLGTPAMARTGSGWLRWFGGGGTESVERPAQTGGALATLERRPPSSQSAPAAPAPAAIAGRPVPGETGIALTDLRPSGAGRFGERRVDVVADAVFIESGATIVVDRDEGFRIVVRRAEQGAAGIRPS